MSRRRLTGLIWLLGLLNVGLLATRVPLLTVERPLDRSSVSAETGLAYWTRLSLPYAWLLSSDGPDNPQASRVRVLEDGKELGPPHALHTQIRQAGRGRYSHWGDKLYFSTSDNSDPRTNGRQYTVRYPVFPVSNEVMWLALALFAGAAVTRLLPFVSRSVARALGAASTGIARGRAQLGRHPSRSWILGPVVPLGREPGRKLIALGALSLTVLLGVRWLSFQPAEHLYSETRVVLEPSDFVKDEGVAYRVDLRRRLRLRFALSTLHLISDDEGSSQLQLFEGDHELIGHALHANIRNSGKGRFSHWGNALIVAASDNSDPTKNGRTYTIVVPPCFPVWHGPLLDAGVLCAFLLALPLLAYAGRRSRMRCVVLSAGLFGVYWTAAFVNPSLLVEVVSLRTWERHVFAGGPLPRSARTSAPRRERSWLLLRDQSFLGFTAARAVSAQRRGTPVELKPAGAKELGGGWTELSDTGVLQNVEPLGLKGSAIGELILDIERREGRHLVVRLSRDKNDRFSGSVEVPARLTGDEGRQRLVLKHPALGQKVVNYISVGVTPNGSNKVVLRLQHVEVRSNLDTFRGVASATGQLEIRGDLRTAFWQSVPGETQVRVGESVSGDLMKFSVGSLSDHPGQAIPLSIRLRDATGTEQQLLADHVTAGDGWKEFSVEFPRSTGGPRTLLLTAPEFAEGTVVAWSGLRVVDRSVPPRRVVVVLVDTLRADVLSSYGAKAGQTPSLDALAAEGVRFSRDYSQAFWTRPSIPSIMTGQYVAATGVQQLSDRLPDSFETIAERFRDAGFTTVSVIRNDNAGPAAGLDAGFYRVILPASISRPTQSEFVLSKVTLPIVDTLHDDDVFLYVHLMEVHGAYGPVEAPEQEPEFAEGGTPVAFNPAFDRPWNPAPTAEQRVGWYLYDVRSTDRALGKFFRALDERWDRADGTTTVVAVMSDHGEYLGENGLWGHIFADLRPEIVHVPLILRAPGILPEGKVIEAPVENRRVASTLVEIAGGLGAPIDQTPLGAPSLMPLIEAGDGAEANAYALSEGGQGENFGQVFSAFGSDHNFIGRFVGQEHISIFDDERCEQPVMGGWGLSMLQSSFSTLREEHLSRAKIVRDAARSHNQGGENVIDARALERLKALGYMGGPQ